METSRSRDDSGDDAAGSPGLRPPTASDEETAAVIAAIEQYLRDTAVRIEAPAQPEPSPWKRAALLEGVSRQPEFGEL